MKIDHIHPNYENADKKNAAIEKMLITVFGGILADRKKNSDNKRTVL